MYSLDARSLIKPFRDLGQNPIQHLKGGLPSLLKQGLFYSKFFEERWGIILLIAFGIFLSLETFPSNREKVLNY